MNDETPAICCPVCAAQARRLHEAYPGYRRPETYDIYACEYCDAQFAAPFRSIGDIYEGIYSQPDIIPGYDRYAAYAREVLESPLPLAHLASREAMYWFIANAMRAAPANAAILEVGSGFGYLTYALVKAGYNARGVDISESAVRAAKQRFGDHYVCDDVANLAQREPGFADIVVMTEVIEHLEKPLDILAAIRNALRPGGVALITTPSKDFHSGDALWRTDLPPVHLAWYSKSSLREMARRVGFSVTFQDFTAMHDERVAGIEPDRGGAIDGAILDADNTVLRRAEPGVTRRTFKRWREVNWPGIARLERRKKFARRSMSFYARESEIIGAILTRRD